MADLRKIYEKQGGKELLRRWRKAGVLPFAAAAGVLLGRSKKSLEILRLAVNNKTLQKLRKKYRPFLAEYRARETPAPREHSKKVWVCWFQGMENAPALVQRCFRSLGENLPGREIVLLTEENYREYVTFPGYIQAKIDAGVIGKAHMADLLRLELLLRYGGTWIDATVFCSGGEIPSYMLDADLFLFQNLKPGLDGHCTCISNWFITACTNHPLLRLTQALLYDYWEKNDIAVDYFIFHDFFQLAIETYPEEWEKVVPFSNATPHILLLRLWEPYDEALYRAVCRQTPFHKLSYKFTDAQRDLPNTYYGHIVGPSGQPGGESTPE